MNYKKIVKSRKIRKWILKFFFFIPDKIMIKIQYKIKTGKNLNLVNPKRFTEKIQYYKLHYRNPLVKKCSDKYTVRDFIKSIGLDYILIPLHSVHNSYKDINFDSLPKSFVAKSNIGGGNNEVLIVDDILKNDVNKIKKLLKKWPKKAIKKSSGREWGYEGNEPKIILEHNLNSKYNCEIIDYKFFCFNGEPKYLYVITDRNTKIGPFLDIYDLSFKKLPFKRPDIKNSNKSIKMPANFKEMIRIAQKISNYFPHVRVDLYNMDGDIYFGELTFYNGSGYNPYVPDYYDFMVGDFFDIKNIKR
ncbi:carbonic anhydrase [Mycoplasmatota bacterium]|nr:carbonic anhydrase [Mycoplasmatota bacterium]